MNDLTTTSALALAIDDVKNHVRLIHSVLQDVMIEDTHYGKPFESRWKEPKEGDQVDERAEKRKLVLLKPGAELLCMTFRIAPRYRVEDLSDERTIRYRVICEGVHQATSTVLGEGIGEASSGEEKFCWRRAICQEEYDNAPESEKRKRYRRGKQSSFYTELQIRENPLDKANTVVKMAAKRAQVAMTLNVTAASDMFTQDIEDEDGASDRGDGPDEPRTRKTPQRRKAAAGGKSTAAEPPPPASEPATPEQEAAQRRELAKAAILAEVQKLSKIGVTLPEVLKAAGIESLDKLTTETFKLAKAHLVARADDIPF